MLGPGGIMDAYDCVLTKLDMRSYSAEAVSLDVKSKVLEAARMTGSGKNSQHWKFVLVDTNEGMKKLAADSVTGGWAANASFAVMVLTDPNYGFHWIDAGRVTQSMQIAAWNFGLVSCLFTNFNMDKVVRDFNLPSDRLLTVVVTFGYPASKVTGKRKNRRSLGEVAFHNRYGQPLKIS
jgi:nitroreductase